MRMIGPVANPPSLSCASSSQSMAAAAASLLSGRESSISVPKSEGGVEGRGRAAEAVAPAAIFVANAKQPIDGALPRGEVAERASTRAA